MAERKVALLEIDGTLANSHDAQAVSWMRAAHVMGFTVPEQTAMRSLVGLPTETILLALLGKKISTKSSQEFLIRRKQIFECDLLASVRALPGAAELVERLQDDGWLLRLAPEVELPYAVKIAEQIKLPALAWIAREQMDTRVAIGRQVFAGPSAVRLCANPYGIEAAQKAQTQSIALLSGGWNEDDFQDATATFRDPANLLRHVLSSPFARQRSRLHHDLIFPLT